MVTPATLRTLHRWMYRLGAGAAAIMLVAGAFTDAQTQHRRRRILDLMGEDIGCFDPSYRTPVLRRAQRKRAIADPPAHPTRPGGR